MAGESKSPSIVRVTEGYDGWLLALEPAFAHDLKRKLKVMAGAPADFLRATFYRWSQRFPQLCLGLVSAPAVRAVGDVHVGNFGTWPGPDGRLRWGLNDFDEAGWMPFTNDLARLATSGLLARDDLDPGTVASSILSGYSRRLRSGESGSLAVDEDQDLQRGLEELRVGEHEYYDKLAAKDKLETTELAVLKPLCERLEELVPGGSLHHRQAGRGSLGRVRIFRLNVNETPSAIEGKRVLRSAWSWARRGCPAEPTTLDDRNDDIVALLTDRRRPADPLTRVEIIGDHQWVLRPLAPDRVGIDFADIETVNQDLAIGLLERMGAEVAHIHLLSRDPEPILSYLSEQAPGWLARAAVDLQEDTEADFHGWVEHRERAEAGSH